MFKLAFFTFLISQATHASGIQGVELTRALSKKLYDKLNVKAVELYEQVPGERKLIYAKSKTLDSLVCFRVYDRVIIEKLNGEYTCSIGKKPFPFDEEL